MFEDTHSTTQNSKHERNKNQGIKCSGRVIRSCSTSCTCANTNNKIQVQCANESDNHTQLNMSNEPHHYDEMMIKKSAIYRKNIFSKLNWEC